MKHVITSGSASIASGMNRINQESIDLKLKPDDLSIKEWLREIRLEKILEIKNEKNKKH